MSIAATLALLSKQELCGVSIEGMLVEDFNIQGEDMKCRR